MNRTVKALALITILFSFQSTTLAQLKLPVSSASIASDIRKVIEDYPNQFMNLQGELLVEHPQSADYACNFNVKGAEAATVTIYSAKHHNVVSWQALMLTTDDFETAKKKFRALYSQMNNLAVQPSAGRTYHLKGDFEAPAEEKKFTSILFSIGAEDALKKLKVELVMVYEPMEWKIKLLVYDREREDDERGSIIEE